MNRPRIFALGVQEGFRQPHSVGMTVSVDHLGTGRSDPYEVLDRGINVGQFLRAGFTSEAWQERFWPFARVPRRTASA